MLLALSLAALCFSQDLKVLKPKIGKVINYTPEQQREWEKAIAIETGGYDTYTKSSEKDKKMVDFLEMMEGPLTHANACSWYCGGGPYKIKASSTLDSSKYANYNAENIHDFNLLTAWCPGNSDTAVGQFVEFFFESGGPRVNSIIVYNGYLKNENLWKKNSRVKRFKFYINNRPYAYLDLADVSAPQTFSIAPVCSNKKNIDLVFKFEIIDVYPGSEYSDVVVSEINFDGLDVHCFGRGTKINLPGNRFKNIEDIMPGDTVMCLNPLREGLSPVIVEKTEKAHHTDLVKYTFENGDTLVSTQDHPFMLDKKGWSSLVPQKTQQYKSFKHVQKVEAGDLFYMIGSNDKWTTNKLLKIESLPGGQETYTVSKLHTGNNFIVNGLLAGAEEL